MSQTPSPNGTVLTVNDTSFNDSSGHIWTLYNGQVAVDGQIDPTTANVIQLAYVNGVVWQENADLLWWAKASPTQPWWPEYGTTANPLQPGGSAVSASDTAVYLPGQTITDASGNTWSISRNGQVLVDGQIDQTTANVIELAYVNGKVWQENGNYLWWSKSSPNSSWYPEYGTPVSPLPPTGMQVSANNTIATQPGQTITDASGNTWSISASGQVLINGAADPTTAHVIELAYEGGQVWQENSADLWWAKSAPSGSWSPEYGTPASPVPGGSTPTQAPALVLTWVGGGSNLVSNPADWSPSASPAPGDTLLVNTISTLNVVGEALAGDTLTVATYNYTTPVTINTAVGAQLSLEDNFSAVDLNVADTTTVNLGAIHGNLTANYGALQFVGNSYLNGLATFNDPLTGNGSVTLTGAQGEGTLMTINNTVGSGLTFNLGAAAPIFTLQLNDPSQFQGALNITTAYPGTSFGGVVFAGLHATSGELANGFLLLFNGGLNTVEAVRVTGQTSTLTLDQTSAGVVLSQNHLFPNDAGAVALPLGHVS